MEYAYAEDILAATGATGALAIEIRRRYAHRTTARGGLIVPMEGIEYLQRWALEAQLVEPHLSWHVERRGADVLVAPVVACGRARRPADSRRGLAAAERMLCETEERAWGTRHRRYRTTPGGFARLVREAAAVAAAWAVVMPIWAALAADAIGHAIHEPVWLVRYRWAQPSPDRLVGGDRVGNDPIYPEGIDPQMPHLVGAPASPAARRAQLRALAELRSEVERIRPRLLGVDAVASPHDANRAGYLLRLAAVESRVPGIYAAVEADPELAAHAERLRRAAWDRALGGAA
jgi:hypothetical protein